MFKNENSINQIFGKYFVKSQKIGQVNFRFYILIQLPHIFRKRGFKNAI